MTRIVRILTASLSVFTVAVSVFSACSSWASRNDKAPDGAAIRSAQQVVQRYAPQHSESFILSQMPPLEGRDVFEIESLNGKIVLRGNNGVSLCSAFYWYLKEYCHANISWNGMQIDLPNALPEVPHKIRRTSPYRYRYFFNYCCFGYSLAWWDWEQWEFIIDWMAMNGVNMPLAVTGQEATWRTVMQTLGLGEDSIQDFFAGPPYLPFQWMGCLDGWGGPLPQSWIDQHAELQKKILARERELGMTPVMQGFTGHVPASIQKKHPNAKLQNIQWIDWETVFLDPLDPLFEKIGKTFLEQQIEQYGTSHLYAADTFIEMSPPCSDPQFLNDMGKSLHSTLASADSEAIWVMQGWIFYNNAKFWQPAQAQAFLDGVPDDRMILLDLYCDVAPVWKKTESFYGKPWIWCVLQNFGNTIALSGPLPRINQELFNAANDPDRGKLSGIGMIQEGLGYNPVVFEFMTEMTWRDQPVDLDRWMANYAVRRYGRSLESACNAWMLLKDSVYNDRHAPHSMVTARPAYREADPILKAGDSKELTLAWEQLLQCRDELSQSDSYRFDLVNVTRQVLSNRAAAKYARVISAYRQKDASEFRSAARDYLQLLSDLDTVLATRAEFLLGKWIADAKRWGGNDEERRLFEWNARNMITLWGDSRSSLHDYARKEWSGLISGFYHPRWKRFFNRLDESLEAGKEFNNDAFTSEIQDWEKSWTHQQNPHPENPIGDSIEISNRLYHQYVANKTTE
ncbi:MAG: alpha-N-acetylglucosaminidase [Candidatus Omnitrophica bacterium]|nr:alpha-N-acetylglucosaminidase [Candidatus Omnitrophota bacterium]